MGDVLDWLAQNWTELGVAASLVFNLFLAKRKQNKF